MSSASARYRFRSGLLRQQLAARELTQEDLARDLGVRLNTVQRWCRGIAQPRGYELIALAEELGIAAVDWYEQPEEAAA